MNTTGEKLAALSLPVALAMAAALATAPAIADAPAAVNVDTASVGQSRMFPDTNENHWAYQAVADLANKGLVDGYSDGKFLGDRTLTRYEFASVVDRILIKLAEVKDAPTSSVTQDDLNKIQVLVDAFRPQLASIQSDVDGAQKEIASLRTQVAALSKQVDAVKATADNSYGAGPNRKYVIGGYVQARYIAASSKGASDFPDGTNGVSNPYNGSYARGGAGASFESRRVRLRVAGQVTPNTQYSIQLDNGSGANSSIVQREARVTYTFGDGSAKYPSISAGQIFIPFGYIFGQSPSNFLTPERPLAFSDTAFGGPLVGQDPDRGISVCWGKGPFKYYAAMINGSGATAGTDIDRRVDELYRVTYAAPSKVWNAGVSYYDGQVSNNYSAGTLTGFQHGAKELLGLDAQFASPGGAFVNGEWLGGRFDQRSYFASPTATTLTTNFAPGNRIDGYYVQGGYTWRLKSVHPLTLAFSYDRFDRSKSGLSDSGDAYTDANLGGGILYNLDLATRLRLWYMAPTKVAHLASAAEPDRIGLITSELQVKF